MSMYRSGKETIDTNTYGQSKGRSGTYSTNWQISGRELLMPDEVRLLDNRDALLFIRGERPVKDQKYDLLKHPNIAYTTDGGADPYRYGEDIYGSPKLRPYLLAVSEADIKTVPSDEYLFFSDDEFEEILARKRKERN